MPTSMAKRAMPSLGLRGTGLKFASFRTLACKIQQRSATETLLTVDDVHGREDVGVSRGYVRVARPLAIL